MRGAMRVGARLRTAAPRARHGGTPQQRDHQDHNPRAPKEQCAITAPPRTTRVVPDEHLIGCVHAPAAREHQGERTEPGEPREPPQRLDAPCAEPARHGEQRPGPEEPHGLRRGCEDWDPEAAREPEPPSDELGGCRETEDHDDGKPQHERPIRPRIAGGTNPVLARVLADEGHGTTAATGWYGRSNTRSPFRNTLNDCP